MAGQIILHGVEVKYLANLSDPISIGDASVIGIVGTAPDAATAKAASVVIGDGNDAILITADAAGAAGNNIRITLDILTANFTGNVRFDPADDKHIIISLATDADARRQQARTQ